MRGFLKGLAAPLMLFAANRAPMRLVELPPLPPIQPVRLPESLTMKSDMDRLGLDFWAAVRRHEQTHAQSAAVNAQGR